MKDNKIKHEIDLFAKKIKRLNFKRIIQNRNRKPELPWQWDNSGSTVCMKIPHRLNYASSSAGWG